MRTHPLLLAGALLTLHHAALAGTDALEEQLKADARRSPAWRGRDVVCYVVAPMSNEKRLPDTLPTDGECTDTLRIVAAKDEYIPASFMVFALRDIDDVQLSVSELRSDKGVIPRSNVDLKVVTCWYKGGNAWYNYFGDAYRKTYVPELLLNDERLIKVDHSTQDNYLRHDYPDGTDYVWISAPPAAAQEPFNYATAPVGDAPSLLPVKLSEGRGKQFWITVRVPRDAVAGVHSGTLTLTAQGAILGTLKLQLRVLPFVLPQPKTYYDVTRDFHVTIYNTSQLAFYMVMTGNDLKESKRLVRHELLNLRRHNVTSPKVGVGADGYNGRALFRPQLELMREAGMSTDVVLGTPSTSHSVMFWAYEQHDKPVPDYLREANMKSLTFTRDTIRKVYGEPTIYACGRDEISGRNVYRSRHSHKIVQDQGMDIYQTATHVRSSFDHGAYLLDMLSTSGYDKDIARDIHAVDGRLMTYARPHSGPENPDFIRRYHGWRIYKNDLDGSGNYRYYSYLSKNVWNDEFSGTKYRIRFVYPTRGGIIDTIHWEAFREGIDDVRYATKLKQLAQQAIEEGGLTRVAGRKALMFLLKLDENTADLNTARLETINEILKLQDILEGREDA